MFEWYIKDRRSGSKAVDGIVSVIAASDTLSSQGFKHVWTDIPQVILYLKYIRKTC